MSSSSAKPYSTSFMRTSSDRSFASRASSKSGATSNGSQTAIHHNRTGSFADFVVKFSELTQEFTYCSSMERIKFPKDKHVQSQHKNVKAPSWGVECECIEVEENDVLQTAYELNRV